MESKKKFDISVFKVLDAVAYAHKIKDVDWAFEAFKDKRYQSRISELRKIANKQTSDDGSGKGRTFSFKKAKALIGALKKLIRVETLKAEILNKIDQIKDPVNRIQFIAEILPKEELATTELYLRAVLEKSANQTESDLIGKG